MLWRSVKGKRNTKGRWEVCKICEGYGKEMQYIGQPHCDWCEGKGRMWREKSDRSYRPSKAKDVYGGKSPGDKA